MLIKNVQVSTNEVTQHGEVLEPIVDALYPNVRGSVDTPATGFVFQPYTRYFGDHDIRYINGGIPKSTKRFKKQGNATVTLTGITTGASAPEQLTVDTVAYVNPANADPDGITFPASIVFNGLSFEGTDTGGESGLTILQGQNFQIKDCGFSKTKVALWMRDVWMTSIADSSFFGQVRHQGGTSANYTNCYATVHDTTVNPGAFRIENLQYSNMTSCASDGTVNGAYYFDQNNGLNVNNCGSEVPASLDQSYGTAAHFHNSNEMILNSFYTLPAAGSNILVSVGDNNQLTFNNMMVYGDPSKWSRDFWLLGTGNTVVVNGGIFGNSGRIPAVATNAAGNTFIYNDLVSGNSYIRKTTAAAITLVLEPKYEKRDLSSTSSIVFSNSGPISTGTKDIKLTKNGNLITIEFAINIGSPSGAVGALLINGLPYLAAEQASGCIATATGLNAGAGPVSVGIARGSSEILFYKTATTAGNTTQVLATDLAAGSAIRGSITYSCVSDWD